MISRLIRGILRGLTVEEDCHMERRKHRRVPVQLQGLLLGNSHEIEGHTLDLSLGGARFESDLDVFPGKTIMVRLVVPGAESPLSIRDARVRWVDEQTFGVEFQNVRPDDLDELEELINEFDEAEQSGHA
jgi:PilZ domain